MTQRTFKLGPVVLSTLISLISLQSIAQDVPQFENPSFEDPYIPGLIWQYVSELPGWDITSAAKSFNLHGESLWESQNGVQHIEFDATNSSIEQTVVGFQNGVEYEVVFAMAGNITIFANYGYNLSISSEGELLASDDFWFDSTGHSGDDMGWTKMKLPFEATNDAATFAFTRIDGGPTNWGPELDNVSLRLANEVLFGDVNCDGSVNLLDVAPFVQLLSDGGFQDEADINEDGVVDLLDVAPFVELLSGG